MDPEIIDRYKSGHSKANVKKYHKEWQKNHITEGYCLDCKRKAVQGKRRCQTHLDYQARLKRRRANERLR